MKLRDEARVSIGVGVDRGLARMTMNAKRMNAPALGTPCACGKDPHSPRCGLVHLTGLAGMHGFSSDFGNE